MKVDLLRAAEVAKQAALAAGKLIGSYLDKDVPFEEKVGGSSRASQVVTQVDRDCEALIVERLKDISLEFDIALLTEETEDDGSRFEKDCFWCIDPIDGTLAFIEKRPGFAVSIALVAKDGSPLIGVIYDPMRKNLYQAIRCHGVYKNEVPWSLPKPQDYLTYVTDHKLEHTPRREEIKVILDQKLKDIGLTEMRLVEGAGLVLNGIFVLENHPACMLKFPKKTEGAGSLWDYAATACFFAELGLPAESFEGEKLDLNGSQGTFMNHQGMYYASFSEETIIPGSASK